MWCCRTTLTDLGPSFIKLGQVLASRPDIVREDYMEELCVLQDDVPSFPDPLVRYPRHLGSVHAHLVQHAEVQRAAEPSPDHRGRGAAP